MEIKTCKGQKYFSSGNISGAGVQKHEPILMGKQNPVKEQKSVDKRITKTLSNSWRGTDRGPPIIYSQKSECVIKNLFSFQIANCMCPKCICPHGVLVLPGSLSHMGAPCCVWQPKLASYPPNVTHSTTHNTHTIPTQCHTPPLHTHAMSHSVYIWRL